ncbi:MAG: M14 family zinc carboxypeptidase [Lacipirellulaceae bacterium]
MTTWENLAPWSVYSCPAGGWKPDAIRAAIDEALAPAAGTFDRRRVATSFEGRPIELVTLGSGPKRVLMWSQMHGDEPTHTTVLLNLMRLLAQRGPTAEALLGGLTMGIIVPLNPDGAERNTRQNGQGIDVNRDAMSFATPEGRALRDTVRDFKPQYGFNLHNQHHRTSIGAPPEPAAVSLLVPPVDADDTVTEATAEAARVAAFFCERARDRCGRRISRYDADYMPRAFGEWVQRQGAATILVEAGGWPGGDFYVLEELHFIAFIQTLEAIATGGLGETRTASYFDLQRSSANHLFDLLVRAEGVAQALDGSITRGDLGIDFPHRKAGWYEFRDGVVRAIGDLHENGGLDCVEGGPAVAAPGRIVLADPDESWESLTAQGVTTALVRVDLSSDGVTERVAALVSTPRPLNAAPVGHWGKSPVHSGSFCEQLSSAVAAGVVAVVGPLPSDSLAVTCERLGVAVLDPATTPVSGAELPASLGDWLAETASVADRLGWSGRGRIGLGVAADFVLVDPEGLPNCLKQSTLGDCLRGVYVGGTVVRDAGGPTPHAPGRWLLRRR